VLPDSPAQKAGLKEGDVIVKLNDLTIRNIEDLNTALSKFKPDDVVKISVERGADKHTFEVKLGRPQ
jgi:serine protease Do